MRVFRGCLRSVCLPCVGRDFGGNYLYGSAVHHCVNWPRSPLAWPWGVPLGVTCHHLRSVPYRMYLRADTHTHTYYLPTLYMLQQTP